MLWRLGIGLSPARDGQLVHSWAQHVVKAAVLLLAPAHPGLFACVFLSCDERAGVCARQAFKDRAGKAAVEKQAFSSSISNFFQTDVISRTSINMAKCVQTRASLAHK